MAISVPTSQEAADKWALVTPQRQQFYTSGVQSAGSRWQAGVDVSGTLWAQATAAAAANGEWQRGVAGKSNKYATNAATIGSQRFAQGVTAAKSAYQTAMGPVLSTIAGVNLPPRQIAGNNLARVQAVNDALHNMKVTT